MKSGLFDALRTSVDPTGYILWIFAICEEWTVLSYLNTRRFIVVQVESAHVSCAVRRQMRRKDCHFTASGTDWHEWQLRNFEWPRGWLPCRKPSQIWMSYVGRYKDLRSRKIFGNPEESAYAVVIGQLSRAVKSIDWKANLIAPLLLTCHFFPRSQFPNPIGPPGFIHTKLDDCKASLGCLTNKVDTIPGSKCRHDSHWSAGIDVFFLTFCRCKSPVNIVKTKTVSLNFEDYID